MNFTRMVERQIDSLFRTMKGLATDAVYRDLTSHGHDSNYRATVQYSDTPIKCIVTTYRLHEIEFGAGRIESADKKILLPLKGLTVPIQSTGKIVIDSTEYGIQNVEIDPTGALATVQARL